MRTKLLLCIVLPATHLAWGAQHDPTATAAAANKKDGAQQSRLLAPVPIKGLDLKTKCAQLEETLKRKDERIKSLQQQLSQKSTYETWVKNFKLLATGKMQPIPLQFFLQQTKNYSHEMHALIQAGLKAQAASAASAPAPNSSATSNSNAASSTSSSSSSASST